MNQKLKEIDCDICSKMELKEGTKTYYIASLSGGQDSSAMTVKILEEGLPLDYIVFCDTGKEFPQMYEYINKLEAYIMKKFGFPLTRLKGTTSFDHWCFGKFTKGKHEGQIRGLPKSSMLDWCTRDLKVYPSDRFCNSLEGPVVRYIGYTYSELERAKPKEGFSYPLIDWQMDEAKISKFLMDRGIWNPLYKHFTRTGCFLCPKQRKRAFFQLYRYYPEQWIEMLEYEKECRELNAVSQTFYPGKTLIEMEEEFNTQDCSKLEYEFGDEKDPEISCFCK